MNKKQAQEIVQTENRIAQRIHADCTDARLWYIPVSVNHEPLKNSRTLHLIVNQTFSECRQNYQFDADKFSAQVSKEEFINLILNHPERFCFKCRNAYLQAAGRLLLSARQ